MNGMKSKSARLRHDNRWTGCGLPRDAKEWTEADWRDLHEAIETIKQQVAKRHTKERNQPCTL